MVRGMQCKILIQVFKLLKIRCKFRGLIQKQKFNNLKENYIKIYWIN